MVKLCDPIDRELYFLEVNSTALHLPIAPLAQVHFRALTDQSDRRYSFRMSCLVELLDSVDSVSDDELLTERVVAPNLSHVPHIQHIVNTERLLLTQGLVTSRGTITVTILLHTRHY